MSRKPWHLPRRSFLRGAGVSLSLPLLEAMGRLSGSAHAAAAASASPTGTVRPPVRMACLYFPNGVWHPTWFPKTAGDDYELTPSLEPLKAHRSKTIVFSGLDKKHSHGGDGHYAKTANFLTGLLVRKTTGKDLSVGSMSVDQIAARSTSRFTPLPSLELGIDPVISGIDSIVGYTRLYGSYISWRSPSQPVAREINPRLAYERLFGVLRAGRTSDPAELQHAADRRALLDLVLDDARSLRGKLGRDDQFKIDEYLDSVREIERRIEFFSAADPREWKPATPAESELAAPLGTPGNHQEHVRLMLDLMVLAFRTDSTRVSTFMFANDVSGKNFNGIIPGVNGSHHEFSHHQNKKENSEPYAKINRWHTEQLAYFLDRLAAIPEGDGNLLDNSMIFFGSSLSDGNSHQPDNLPIILAGGGGGTIRGGRHFAATPGTPLCNLYVSLLERMGTPVDSFGDSTAALALG